MPKAEQVITPELIAEMHKNMTEAACAMALDKRVRETEPRISSLFVELGIIGKAMDDWQLWKCVVKEDGDLCHSWEDWATDALPVSSRYAFSAKLAANQLEHIPVEERIQIPVENQKTLSKLSPSLRKSTELRSAAKKLKPKELTKKIAKEHPDQHIEESSPMLFNPERSRRRSIEEALDMAIALGDADSRDEALEALAIFYKERRPDFTKVEEIVLPNTVH